MFRDQPFVGSLTGLKYKLVMGLNARPSWWTEFTIVYTKSVVGARSLHCPPPCRYSSLPCEVLLAEALGRIGEPLEDWKSARRQMSLLIGKKRLVISVME
jgi:hypothetical protein